MSGAIAMIDNKRIKKPALFDLPTTRRYNGRTRLHGYATKQLLEGMIQPDQLTFIGCEAIHAMPVNGSVSVFSQGSVCGSLEAIFDMLEHKHRHLQVQYISPAKWKNHFNLMKKTKEDGRQKALRIFSGLTEGLNRKLDHNRAEAALIARYLWDQVAGEMYTGQASD